MVSDKSLDLYLTENVVLLADGYSRLKVKPLAWYRYLRPDEARALDFGDEVACETRDGTARRVRCSGKARTWKRNPERLEIPFKYGFYESATFEARDGRMISSGGAALLVKIGS